MASDYNPLVDIKTLAPPDGDSIVYLNFLRKIFIADKPPPDLRRQLLEKFDEILQSNELANILGWEALPILLEVADSESCLSTIARLGNPRECILGVLEELQKLDLEGIEDDWQEEENTADGPAKTREPNDIDQFCTLLNLLSILHPRLKTRHPSRFLGSTIIAIINAYQPSHRATIAVGQFVHVVSGKKRPTLPGRKSSLSITNVMRPDLDTTLPTAPDPEAQEEDKLESAIQKKLLQGLVTAMLDFYISEFPLEWAGRLLESFDPKRVVAGRTTLAEAFQTKPEFQIRDTVVGQLVSLCRDLGLANYDLLFEAMYPSEPIEHAPNPEDDLPDSPEQIPLSANGCLYLLTSLLFSSIMFQTKTPEPTMAIFPDHAKLMTQFFEPAAESPLSIPDAVLAVGLWLEHTNKFVSGEFKDNDFFTHVRALSLWSATNSSPGLRYCAHILTSAILHAHPADNIRLTFISKTLQDTPDEVPCAEALKVSAITWLKEELITAHERKTENLFSTTGALLATKQSIFPNLSTLEGSSDEELVENLMQNFSLHMAALNFLFFLAAEQYKTVVPEGMMKEVETSFLDPLQSAQARALSSLGPTEDAEPDPHMSMELLGEQVSMCLAKLHEK